VLHANDEIARRSGLAQVTWFGLRLGATLAALAARAAARSPTALVLWDPVLDGAAYLAELADAHVAARREAFGMRWSAESRVRSLVTEEAKTEVLGYPLTPDLKAQLRALSPASLRGARAGRVTLVGARADDGLAALRDRLAGDGVRARIQTIGSAIAWLTNDMLNDSTIPQDDLRTLVGTLAEDA
jgi:pimeloyl-ACP methyl ester carboxylesterase